MAFTNRKELADLIDQSILILPSFTLECAVELKQVPVAYKTWGTLNEPRDNVMVICHALTGSADVEDWWGPLMGRGKAFDPSRYFIFCANVLGSPYGTASPTTINPETGMPYGPEFPPTSIRDDVRLHKLVLDHLNVSSVAVVIGGSMGGMAVLEWPLCTPPSYVRTIVPLATSARHSAWCISWGEAQRQSIYTDPTYEGGYYYLEDDGQGQGGVRLSGKQPESGLGAARMAALLTYRSRDSFESRFGRKAQHVAGSKPCLGKSTITNGNGGEAVLMTPPSTPKTQALAAHNEGIRSPRLPPSTTATSQSPSSPQPVFSAQSYLRYQADKFTSRFDANCYIHITHKMDTHDLARGRYLSEDATKPFDERPSFSFDGAHGSLSPSTCLNTNTDSTPLPLEKILSLLPPTLTISIETDGLFTTSEQAFLHAHIPRSELAMIPSPDGHDGFLLEFERIDGHVKAFLKRELGEIYSRDEEPQDAPDGKEFEAKKTSVFGEAEVEITNW